MHNIVYITDENYILPTKASINSIVQNVKDTELCVNVIAVDVSEKNQNELKKLSSKNITLKILNFDNEFSNLGLDHHYVSKAALFKFQLPNIFTDLDRILYVDGDMILFHDFLEIFDFDISDKYAAVVQDMLACFMEFDKKLGHAKYFNSGMMFLNLKKMRENFITEKLIEYKKNDSDKSFMDQNALNAILGTNSLYINPKFNLMATCTPKEVDLHYGDGKPLIHMADFYNITEMEMKFALERPAILHVTTETKAWKNIHSARIDSWIPFVTPDDTLKVTKNWCNTISKEENEHFLSLQEKFINQENKISWLENRLSEQERKTAAYNEKISVLEEKISKQNTYLSEQELMMIEQGRQISDLKNQLTKTYNLLVNTRHRTLYGACAWLWHKIFKKR